MPVHTYVWLPVCVRSLPMRVAMCMCVRLCGDVKFTKLPELGDSLDDVVSNGTNFVRVARKNNNMPLYS